MGEIRWEEVTSWWIRMTGDSNLESLLKNMKPVIVPGEYVFCSVKENQLKEVKDPLLVFREYEGPTVIITKTDAEQMKLHFDSTWGLISMTIHSDLEAVGFLAIITSYLAKAGISVNAVSAYYHDHLFVPFARVAETVTLLMTLSDSYSK
jgi:hypothetical protein